MIANPVKLHTSLEDSLNNNNMTKGESKEKKILKKYWLCCHLVRPKSADNIFMFYIEESVHA